VGSPPRLILYDTDWTSKRISAYGITTGPDIYVSFLGTAGRDIIRGRAYPSFGALMVHVWDFSSTALDWIWMASENVGDTSPTGLGQRHG
jgi:hypothetical protein